MSGEKLTAGIGKGTPGPGRKKGIPNKQTAEVKEMILAALQAAGGVEYLLERAHDEKTRGAFMALVGKVLPLQLQGDPNAPIMFEKIVREIVKPK